MVAVALIGSMIEDSWLGDTAHHPECGWEDTSRHVVLQNGACIMQQRCHLSNWKKDFASAEYYAR